VVICGFPHPGMKVTVRLHASLRRHGDSLERELGAGATVADLMAQLPFPAEHAGMIVSGDRQLEMNSALRDGQEINLFPPLAGG